MVIIEIAGETDCHVIRAIICLIELFNILQARVLEVFLRAEHGVLTVRNIRIKQLVDRQIHFLHVHRGVHIKLLVNGLEFGMEAAYYEVLEAVGLDHRPACQFSGRYHFVIAGTLVAREGIDTGCADSTHQFVELIRHRNLGILIGERVDKMVYSLALSRVCRRAVEFVERIDGVEVRQLFLVVGRAVRLRTLEHNMLLVVRQTCRFQRVILTSGAHGDERLYLGFLLVLTQIYGKAVIKCVDTRLQRVTIYCTIRVLLAGTHQSNGCQKKK